MWYVSRLIFHLFITYYSCEALSWAELCCDALGFFTTWKGVLVFLRFFLLLEVLFVQMAVWPKSESKIAVWTNFFWAREVFRPCAVISGWLFDMISVFWQNDAYRQPFLAVFLSNWPSFFCSDFFVEVVLNRSVFESHIMLNEHNFPNFWFFQFSFFFSGS